MYICNLLKEHEVSARNGKFTYKDADSENNIFEGYFALSGDGSITGPVTEGRNIFLEHLTSEDKSQVYRVGKVNGRKREISYELVQETAENPLIIVLCHEISIYDNIECDIRYINLGNGVICAMLVTGVCSFDGIPMQRCNTQNYQSVLEYTYTAEDLEKFADTMYVDRECQYHYGNDVVCTLAITRHEIHSINYKKSILPADTIFLDRSNLDKALERHKAMQAEAKAREEELVRERKERTEKAREEARLRAEEAEREAAEKQRRKEERANKASSAVKSEETVEGSLGASAFLAAVRGL